ncbi:MAG: DNA repair protein RecO [Lachnospiraceae bacterium]
MTGQIKLTGMVLAAMPVGEYDRRLTILTKERGKISAFAKGARKPTSALLACSQPFSFGEFVLYEGKSSYNVVSGDISNYFAELREDLTAIYYGMYFCEFATYMTKENLEAGEQLKVLYMALRALTKEAIPKRLVRYIFELRFLAAGGEMPQVFGCVHCGKEDMLKQEKAWFLAEEGGLYCDECRERLLKEQRTEHTDSLHAESGQVHGRYLPDVVPAKAAVLVGTSTIYTMQYIVSTPLGKLFTFTVSEEVLNELGDVMKRFLEKQVGHTMKSEQMLETLL